MREGGNVLPTVILVIEIGKQFTAISAPVKANW
jgi:hypothetical protein